MTRMPSKTWKSVSTNSTAPPISIIAPVTGMPRIIAGSPFIGVTCQAYPTAAGEPELQRARLNGYERARPKEAAMPTARARPLAAVLVALTLVAGGRRAHRRARRGSRHAPGITGTVTSLVPGDERPAIDARGRRRAACWRRLRQGAGHRRTRARCSSTQHGEPTKPASIAVGTRVRVWFDGAGRGVLPRAGHGAGGADPRQVAWAGVASTNAARAATRAAGGSRTRCRRHRDGARRWCRAAARRSPW